MDNILENDLVLLQISPNIAANLSNNFLYHQNCNGEYTPLRKLLDWEIMQVEDQRDYNIILNI